MNDCCEHNKRGCKYGVGSNIPGYMPDSDVEHFGNFIDARDCFVADCEAALEEVENPQCYTIERSALRRISKQRKIEEQSMKIGDYVYWLCKL